MSSLHPPSRRFPSRSSRARLLLLPRLVVGGDGRGGGRSRRGVDLRRSGGELDDGVEPVTVEAVEEEDGEVEVVHDADVGHVVGGGDVAVCHTTAE